MAALGMDRPEDRNAFQQWDTWPQGATLTEVEAFVRALRGRGAPDDAHPVAKLNGEGEIVGMVCVVERAWLAAPKPDGDREAEYERYAYGTGIRL